jgi:hypothetical protein
VDYTKWTREELVRLRGELEAEIADGDEIAAVTLEIQRRDVAALAAAPPAAAVAVPISAAVEPTQQTQEHASFRLSRDGEFGNSGGWRKMTWAIHVWNAIFVIWILWGIFNVSQINAADTCSTDPSVLNGILTQSQCEDASNAGTAIGAGLGFSMILGLWFVGFVVLAIIWLMTKPARRSCPVCGESVKIGVTVCEACGHDFALAVAATAAT